MEAWLKALELEIHAPWWKKVGEKEDEARFGARRFGVFAAWGGHVFVFCFATVLQKGRFDGM